MTRPCGCPGAPRTPHLATCTAPRRARKATWKRSAKDGHPEVRLPPALADAVRGARARGTDEELESHIDGFKR